MKDNNVIFLAHRNDDLKTDGIEVLACGTCSNKTWLAVYEAKNDGAPRLKCACCGMSGGVFGWIGEES